MSHKERKVELEVLIEWINVFFVEHVLRSFSAKKNNKKGRIEEEEEGKPKFMTQISKYMTVYYISAKTLSVKHKW